MTDTLLLGQTLCFSGDPFKVPWTEVTSHRRDGAVLLRGGKIAEVGSRAALCQANPPVSYTHLTLPTILLV